MRKEHGANKLDAPYKLPSRKSCSANKYRLLKVRVCYKTCSPLFIGPYRT